MAAVLPGDVSHHGSYQGGSYSFSLENMEDGARWYFSRKEIEENSPSKQDGIDLKKETYLRKSYCTFLQDLGMRLKVPQVTIATAIIFCHRFFLRQSHGKNDRRTIATVCMFLAGKVEETPRPLKDVILVSYEIIHKKDTAAVQRIKQKEVYEQQKELILLGERVVLATLGFDFNVHHPYKPLVEAIKKFKVAQNALAQVAWNFVNDGLRTSLCLQFLPHHIAAGAIFLAAKFLKVKLPSDGEKVWWQEFDVTPRQLEEVSNQMLELYEQNRMPPSSDVEGSAGGGARGTAKTPTRNEETTATICNSHTGGTSSRPETLKPASSRSVVESSANNHDGHPATTHTRSSDYGSTETSDKADDGPEGNQHTEREPSYKENMEEAKDAMRFQSGLGEDQENSVGRNEMEEAGELNDKHNGQNLDPREGTFTRPPQEAIKRIDKYKLKAALEKRRKESGGVTRKTEFMDEDDLIERELEDGIELAAESEKNKQGRRQNWPKPSDESNRWTSQHGRQPDDRGDEPQQGIKGKPSHGQDLSTVEEGEVSALDDVGSGFQSPKSNNRKRKAVSPPEKVIEGKERHNYGPGSHHHNRPDYMEDRNKVGRLGHSERENRRHSQENHV
ncbi:Cyclin T1 [Quillaja saponaria]|uniref:B-like cyclin n=1 Tax=Quillaja saponaria TaxID=32244 RepID=A0AAD7QII8_QUISA|nr:Cyclin T1 [Quillaja saponaria]